MAKSTTEKQALIHQEAMQRFNRIQSALKDERLQCLQDRRFYSIAGAQWEGDLAKQFANKPRFEVNKVHLSVIRIFNEYRNNRITVDFISKDGTTDDKLADVCNGLYRADEQDSCAQEAYDNAFEEATGGGYGAYRLRSCYEDEEDPENDHQRIKIEPIFDADSCVFFDLDAKRQDKSDAKCCFVLSSMTHDAYIEEYGDDPASWPKAIHQQQFDWLTPDLVYIAEYYRVEETKDYLITFKGMAGDDDIVKVRLSELKGDDADDYEENLKELEATGYTEEKRKPLKVRKVRKYILSGNGILEDCGYIAGKYIPIIPVYGKRWVVDGVERCMGHVRLAKDASRLGNMLRSKIAEIASLSSIEKPIFFPEQMAGHSVIWAEDNQENYPWLPINPMTDANGQIIASGAVDYTRSPQIPPAIAALAQLVEQDLKDLLGNQQGADQIMSNISGKAVEMIQNRLDMQTYIYMSNTEIARRWGGTVWLSMAKELYVEDGRKMKSIGARGEVESVELNKPMMSPEGEIEYRNDLSQATFDVVSDVGPSSDSKRQATVRALTGMMQMTQDQEALTIMTAMALMNMEGEGMADIRRFYRRKLVEMGIVEPTEQEAQELQAAAENQQQDPNAVFMQAAAEEATANAAKARAQTVDVVASAEKKRAETLKTLSEIDLEAQRQAIESAKALSGMVTESAQTVAEPATAQPEMNVQV